MTIDPARLREDLHRASDGLVLAPDLLQDVRRGAGRRLRRRRAGSVLTAGALGAAVVLAAPLARTWTAGDPAGQAAGPAARPAALPDRMAGYSYLTGSVSSSSPGRAVALFQHGFGVEALDLPQAVVVGADGDVYRRVDLAEDRADDQGDPAPMLLSPDGTRIAVGHYDEDRADLALLDLATGDVEVHRVPAARSVVPLAWSRDGRLAYVFGPDPTSPHSGTPIAGAVGVLDTTAGDVRELPAAGSAETLAFSPDGTELAVQHRARAGGVLQVFGLDGRLRRTLTPPGGHHLDGADAWSPDGMLLATSRPPLFCGNLVEEAALRECAQAAADVRAGIGFVDATGRGRPVPEPLPPFDDQQGRVLGWASPEALLVLAPDSGTSGAGKPWVTRVPVDGGAVQRISSVSGGGNYGVGRFQLAGGLLADLQVRPAGDADRGPWPPWFLVIVLLVVVAAVQVGRDRLRRARYRRASRLRSRTGLSRSGLSSQ